MEIQFDILAMLNAESQLSVDVDTHILFTKTLNIFLLV